MKYRTPRQALCESKKIRQREWGKAQNQGSIVWNMFFKAQQRSDIQTFRISVTFKDCQNNIKQNTLLLTAVTERDMFLSAPTHIPAHHTHMPIPHRTHKPAVSSLSISASRVNVQSGNSPYYTPHSESQVVAVTWGETWSTVLFFMALSQAGMSHYKALLMSRGGAGNKSLLDLQT